MITSNNSSRVTFDSASDHPVLPNRTAHSLLDEKGTDLASADDIDSTDVIPMLSSPKDSKSKNKSRGCGIAGFWLRLFSKASAS